MFQRYRKRLFIIILGDFLCFYTALFIALILRYGFLLNKFFKLKIIFVNSFFHFSFIFLIWFLLFTISRLYEFPYLISNREFYFLAFKLFLIGGFFAVLVFYIFTPQLVPKLVLLLTIIFSLIFLIIWRSLINWLLKERKRKIIFISQVKEKEELILFIKSHPSFGLEILESFFEPEVSRLESIIKNNKKTKKIYFVVDNQYQKLISDRFKDKNIEIIDFGQFYETLTGKVALSLLTEEWFKNCFSKRNLKTYEVIKRIFDFLGGIILLIISLPLWPIIGILIKIDSSGPILFCSFRIGKGGKKFLIYKFRTMVKNANQIGPAWTLEKDKRITKIGKILRFTHLDEIPQVINIIKGETSFVGPRPEEEKLVELFKKEIPFYEKRMLIKPGIIGWAQINYPHGASIKDAIEKLKYDFYYLKHRSLGFDFSIALKAWRIPFEIKTH
ncbi:MAG: exopolysaccharide biosynthesis polyprenyl glycosylphosphotransferase [Minisyncoccia bacterium]